MTDVPSAVLSSTNDPNVQASMLLGSSLEGGWNAPYPVGDGGTSFGPYQMHQGGLLTSLGLTPKQAENAATATKAMLPIYQKAASSIPSSLWNSNPEQAAEQTAVAAEKPAQDYFTSAGQAKVDNAWNQSVNAMGGNAQLTSSPLGGITGLLGFPNLLQFLGLAPSNIKSGAERIGLILLGGMLVLVGFIVFALPAAKAAAGEAAGLSRTGRAIGLTSSAAQGERERRSEIAERSLALGEAKQRTKEARETRLATMSRAKLNRGVG